jgi:hypothetical protein
VRGGDVNIRVRSEDVVNIGVSGDDKDTIIRGWDVNIRVSGGDVNICKSEW